MLAALSLSFLQERVVVVQVEYERGLIGWIVIGLIAGWLAGKIARGAGYGCITDIILGLVGSVLGGWLFMKLGILRRRLPRTASQQQPWAPSSRSHRAPLRRQSLTPSAAGSQRIPVEKGQTRSALLAQTFRAAVHHFFLRNRLQHFLPDPQVLIHQ